MPWNGPVLLLIRSLAPALAAGCTCVVKPAAQTALITVAVLEELAAITALPAGAVNLVIEVGHAAGEHLVESPHVDVVSFTGSTATGQRIMVAAAPTMKKLSLELGGKSCCLVFEDADIDAVAPMLASAATIISGQQCTAARRVLVHASRAEEMKAALLNKDKTQATTVKTKKAARAAVAAKKPSAKAGKSSTGFKTGGSAYDPLNGKL